MRQIFVSFLLLMSGLFCETVYAQQWITSPQIIGEGVGNDTINGFVFNDSNKNGVMDESEVGVSGVLVSNGLDWVKSDANGFFEIAVREDMDLTIVQPSGWRVPTDNRLVPQFFYIHKAGGTGYEMRYGGLPDTGSTPAQINFPLNRDGADGEQFSCAVLGDPQT